MVQELWHDQMEILKEKVKQCETESPHLNGNTVDEIEETLLKLIGQLLTPVSYWQSSVEYLRVVAQSSLASPKMVEATSYALSVMGNLLTSMCVQLKTSISTLPVYLKTTRKVGVISESLNELTSMIEEAYKELNY